LGQKCTAVSTFPSIVRNISTKIHVSLEQQKTAFVRKIFTMRGFSYETVVETAKNRKKRENLHLPGALAKQIRRSRFYFAVGPERTSAHRQAGLQVKYDKRY
jgi:hypothetical protein